MKTYCVILSRTFPVTHTRAGEPTEFRTSFVRRKKIHTIRGNFPLWEKRFEEIQKGEACLAIRQWSGRPYWSPMIEIDRLTRDDGIGLQQLRFTLDGDNNRIAIIDNVYFPSLCVLADNDGLLFNDWNEWFSGSQCSQPMAIIHFTEYRY